MTNQNYTAESAEDAIEEIFNNCGFHAWHFRECDYINLHKKNNETVIKFIFKDGRTYFESLFDAIIEKEDAVNLFSQFCIEDGKIVKKDKES